MAKKRGYLIITLQNADELSATFVTDKELFDRLSAIKDIEDLEEAVTLWTEWCEEHSEDEDNIEWIAESPSASVWKFNGVEILGTYYINLDVLEDDLDLNDDD
jgi:hypothetical protein